MARRCVADARSASSASSVVVSIPRPASWTRSTMVSRSVRKAPVFYGLVALGTLGGTLLTLTSIDPVKLLVYSALINGLLAAPFLVLVMIISEDADMGDYTNGVLARILGWAAALLMATAALAYLVLTYG